jgi:diguanylate cyclase (GGDEF)-like protein
VTVANQSRALAARARPAAIALSGSQRLVIFAAFLGIIGTALWLGPLRDVHRISTVASLPWWVFAVACYVSSLLYVEVRLHRELTTLSLTEIPVAMGLFLVDPRVLLGCYAGGVLLAGWTRRRFRPAKDFSNLMLDLLYMGATVMVFTAIGPDPGDPLSPRSILSLAVAMAIAGWVVGPLALNIGSFLFQGSIHRADALRALAFQMVATATNTCLGIVGLLFIIYRPLLVFALIPPIALVLLGQLAAGESQRRADRMEFLYRTSDILHSSKQMRERTGELLSGMRHMFGVARAELIVIPESRGPALRFTTSGGDDELAAASSELTFAEQETLNALRHGRVLSGSDADVTAPLAALLAERNVSFGTVVALRGRDRPQGMLLLIDPLDGKKPLPAQEQNLLLTVAGQISVALENGQLADAIHAMTVEKAELSRRAFYDQLTQIPNRSLFTDSVGKALSRVPGSKRPIAALFVDLDGFKEINDTYGHAVGDQVLNAIATRLRNQLRKLDMAARLGGDEFALLLDGMRHHSDANVVAQRVVELLREPIPVSERIVVTVGGSVGVAVVDDPADVPPVEELMRRADMAMYLAKRQGKGRYVIFDRSSRDPVVVAGGGLLSTATGG